MSSIVQIIKSNRNINTKYINTLNINTCKVIYQISTLVMQAVEVDREPMLTHKC